MLFDSHVLRMFLEVAPLLIPHFVVLLTCGLSFVTLFGYNLVFDDYDESVDPSRRLLLQHPEVDCG